jgi:hypothetical protein
LDVGTSGCSTSAIEASSERTAYHLFVQVDEQQKLRFDGTWFSFSEATLMPAKGAKYRIIGLFRFRGSGSISLVGEFLFRPFEAVCEGAKSVSDTLPNLRKFSSPKDQKGDHGHYGQMSWCEQFAHIFSREQ